MFKQVFVEVEKRSLDVVVLQVEYESIMEFVMIDCEMVEEKVQSLEE